MLKAFPKYLKLSVPAMLLLAPIACTRPLAGYPSLAPRPIENLSLTEPDRPAAAAQSADPARAAHYAPFVERARTADVAFQRVLDEERAVLVRGRGAGAGTDAWTAAQESLSRVETAREPAARALADLDAARSDNAALSSSSEEIATEQAFRQVEQIVDAEQAALSVLWPQSNR